MNNKELKNWCINNNAIRKLYTHCYVAISNDGNGYKMSVADKDLKMAFLNFKYLDAAISFSENIIANCMDTQEVIYKYEQHYVNKDILDDDEYEEVVINLSKQEVEQAILDYYGHVIDNKISLKADLHMINNEVNIDYYLIEYFTENSILNKNIVKLSNEDIKSALMNYAENFGYVLKNFEFSGGVQQEGNYLEKSTPYYDGIKITVKQKNHKPRIKN